MFVMANKSFKVFWLIIGFICLVLGTIGVFLPVLPTVPFYLVTTFAFAKSSDRLHNWFINTKIYKKNLESFVERKAMTLGLLPDRSMEQTAGVRQEKVQRVQWLEKFCLELLHLP